MSRHFDSLTACQCFLSNENNLLLCTPFIARFYQLRNLPVAAKKICSSRWLFRAFAVIRHRRVDRVGTGSPGHGSPVNDFGRVGSFTAMSQYACQTRGVWPGMHFVKLTLSMHACTHKLDGCIVWNAHNTVLVSKRSIICIQAVYFLHSMWPSVTWFNSRWWLAACDWGHDAWAALSCVVNPRRSSQKIWEVYCTESTGQGNDFELIPTVQV